MLSSKILSIPPSPCSHNTMCNLYYDKYLLQVSLQFLIRTWQHYDSWFTVIIIDMDIVVLFSSGSTFDDLICKGCPQPHLSFDLSDQSALILYDIRQSFRVFKILPGQLSQVFWIRLLTMRNILVSWWRISPALIDKLNQNREHETICNTENVFKIKLVSVIMSLLRLKILILTCKFWLWNLHICLWSA